MCGLKKLNYGAFATPPPATFPAAEHNRHYGIMAWVATSGECLRGEARRVSSGFPVA